MPTASNGGAFNRAAKRPHPDQPCGFAISSPLGPMNVAAFSTIFSLGGMRLLFGGYNVGVGTILLLAAVSVSFSYTLESLFLDPGDYNASNSNNSVALEEVVLEAAQAAWAQASGVIDGLQRLFRDGQ